jgi:hypothetical protein
VPVVWAVLRLEAKERKLVKEYVIRIIPTKLKAI